MKKLENVEEKMKALNPKKGFWSFGRRAFLLLMVAGVYVGYLYLNTDEYECLVDLNDGETRWNCQQFVDSGAIYYDESCSSWYQRED